MVNTSIKKSLFKEKRNQKLFTKNPQRILIISFHVWSSMWKRWGEKSFYVFPRIRRKKLFSFFFIIFKFHQKFSCYRNGENLFTRVWQRATKQICVKNCENYVVEGGKKEFKVFQFSWRLFSEHKRAKISFPSKKAFKPSDTHRHA